MIDIVCFWCRGACSSSNNLSAPDRKYIHVVRRIVECREENKTHHHHHHISYRLKQRCLQLQRIGARFALTRWGGTVVDLCHTQKKNSTFCTRETTWNTPLCRFKNVVLNFGAVIIDALRWHWKGTGSSTNVIWAQYQGGCPQLGRFSALRCKWNRKKRPPVAR